MPSAHRNKSSQSKPISQKLKSQNPIIVKNQSKSLAEKPIKPEMPKSTPEKSCSNVSKIDSVGPNRFQVLSYEQVKRLHRVIERPFKLKPVSHSDLPVIEVSLRALLGEIKRKLKEVDVVVKDVRLDGSAAGCILNLNPNDDFKEVNVIFTVNLNDMVSMQKIKNTIFSLLIDLLKKNLNSKPECLKQSFLINEELIKDNYIQKMSRVLGNQESNTDCWSLISLGTLEVSSETVELKFIDKMKRQYEFTIDSFQIVLDTMLAFYTVSKCSSITPNLFPTVVAESVSGSFQEAFKHLKENIISTKNPEEILGGGLLKYCGLLAVGFQQNSAMDVRATEKYMCSRFFIDYPDINVQRQKLEAFLDSLVDSKYEIKINLLNVLYDVVSHSTVCLMTHERRQTLQMINSIIQNILSEIEIKKSTVQLDDLSSQNWVLDQVFYGTFYFPQQVYVTGPMNASQSNNINLGNISGNQILICTGDNTDFITTSNQIVSVNQTTTTAIDSSSWLGGYQNQNNQIYCCNDPLMCA